MYTQSFLVERHLDYVLTGDHDIDSSRFTVVYESLWAFMKDHPNERLVGSPLRITVGKSMVTLNIARSYIYFYVGRK